MLLPSVPDDLAAMLDTMAQSSMTRQIVYARSDSNQRQPRQQVSINLPSSKVGSITDFRSSYLSMDVELTGIIPAVDAVFAFVAVDELNNPQIVTAGNFNINFGQSTSKCFSVVDTDAFIREELLMLPDFQDLVGRYGGDLTVVNDLQVDGTLLITVLSDNYDSRDSSVTGFYHPKFYITNAKLFGGVVFLVFGCDSAETVEGEMQYPRTEMGSTCFIQRVELEINSDTVVELDLCNILGAINMYTKNKEWIETNGNLTSLTGNIYSRGWTGERRIEIDLRYMQALATLWPIGLSEGQDVSMRLLITLAPTTECLIQKTVNDRSSYVCRNIEWHYHLIELEDPVLLGELQDRINSEQGLSVIYSSWQNFTSEINSSGSPDILLNYSFARFLGYTGVFRQKRLIQDVSANRKLSTFLKLGVNNYRLKINNRYYPSDSVEFLDNPLDPRGSEIEGFKNFLNMFSLNMISEEHLSSTLASVNYDSNGLFDTITAQDTLFFYPSSFITAISVSASSPHDDVYSLKHLPSAINLSNRSRGTIEFRGLTLQDKISRFDNTLQEFPVTFNCFGKYSNIVIFKLGGNIVQHVK